MDQSIDCPQTASRHVLGTDALAHEHAQHRGRHEGIQQEEREQHQLEELATVGLARSSLGCVVMHITLNDAVPYRRESANGHTDEHMTDHHDEIRTQNVNHAECAN